MTAPRGPSGPPSPAPALAALLLLAPHTASQASSPQHAPAPCEGPSCANLPVLPARGHRPEWDAYLEAVYGAGSVRYPYDCGRLRWLYTCVDPPDVQLLRFARKFIRQKRTTCTRLPRRAPLTALTPQPINLFGGLPPVGRAWIPGPESDGLRALGLFGTFVGRTAGTGRGAPPGSWVEVMRIKSVPEAVAFKTTWYFGAPGSGIWLNVGRTLVTGNAEGWANQRRLIATARAQGYDTLQLPDSWNSTVDEIVDLRKAPNQGSKGWTCGANLRRGWAHEAPCACTDALPVLNCAGAGEEGARHA